MTFQAYIDTVKAKTDKSPEELKQLADQAGIYSQDMKAGELAAWPGKKFGLGHGHSMAIRAVWKDKGWVKALK